MPRAAPLALLLALAALLAPTAFAATCVYCKGKTRLSCYTGFPIAPDCKWWGSSTPVSLKHCGTVASCDDLLTRGGVTYQLKAVLDYNGACPNPDSPVECDYDNVHYESNRRRALLGTRRALQSAQAVPVVTAEDAQPAAEVQPAAADAAPRAAVTGAADDNDGCMARVLDDLNQATEAAKAQAQPLSDDQLRFHMSAWEACGGVNPYHLTVAAGADVGGRRLLGRANCSKLSCFRNGITDGGVLCNAWCGFYAICDAKPGKWGKCKYVG
ncbi:DNA degradation [Chlorella sorokiniana]|uniref:DNA degradation n=1 Tax=Chlorella sorokiniana TaxID=3076 RepID=A0A2P6TTU3_CHLSO|nr:DNA degradation [Chlorella sorokiniana]|eukprot:PRW57498.1 DNA degradation [Chlorella sorokiniana]